MLKSDVDVREKIKVEVTDAQGEVKTITEDTVLGVAYSKEDDGLQAHLFKVGATSPNNLLRAYQALGESVYKIILKDGLERGVPELMLRAELNEQFAEMLEDILLQSKK